MTFNKVFCEGYTIYAIGLDGRLYSVNTEEWFLWEILMPAMREEVDALEKYILPEVIDSLNEMKWEMVTVH